MANIAKAFTAAAAALLGAAALSYSSSRSGGPKNGWYDTAPPTSSPIQPAPTAGAPSYPVVLPPSSANAKHSQQVVKAFSERCLEAAALGTPSDAEVRCYGGYLSSLNYERRIPNWVLEVVDYRRLKPASSQKAGASSNVEEGADDGSDTGVSRNRSAFYADATVPTPFRVATNAYTTRGLSRGHLSPAQLHKDSQDEMDATFNMNANIVPQDMTMNAVDWLRLENLVRKLSSEVVSSGKKGKKDASNSAEPHGKLYVVTGPAFVPRTVMVERRADGTEVQIPTNAASTSATAKQIVQYELTGKPGSPGVAVPTHMYKLILAEKYDTYGKKHYESAAFMMPNEPIPTELPLTAYQVPVERLEKLVGVTFFPGLKAPVHKLPDLCRSHKCEARGSALFAKYRQVAQLRAATTIPELRRIYVSFGAENNKNMDTQVKQEYAKRVEELAAEAVRPIDG